jgi:hypothetical protein
MKLVENHRKIWNTDQGTSLPPCTRVYTTTLGVPCAHVVQGRLRAIQPLEVIDFHLQWRLDRLETLPPLDPPVLLRDPAPVRIQSRPKEDRKNRRLPSGFEIQQRHPRRGSRAGSQMTITAGGQLSTQSAQSTTPRPTGEEEEDPFANIEEELTINPNSGPARRPRDRKRRRADTEGDIPPPTGRRGRGGPHLQQGESDSFRISGGGRGLVLRFT